MCMCQDEALKACPISHAHTYIIAGPHLFHTGCKACFPAAKVCHHPVSWLRLQPLDRSVQGLTGPCLDLWVGWGGGEVARGWCELFLDRFPRTGAAERV
jgi:hypothetical protein